MGTQKCIQCGIEKDENDFAIAFKNQNLKNGYNQNINRKKRCKTCYAKRERLKIRYEFIEAYGGICACCSEDDWRFLGLDHINNDGNEQRLDFNCQQIYYQARKEGYPKDKYQILCHNCNFGKSINNGICPHNSISKETYIQEIKEFINHKGPTFKNYNPDGLKLGPVKQREDARIAKHGTAKEKMILAFMTLGKTREQAYLEASVLLDGMAQ